MNLSMLRGQGMEKALACFALLSCFVMIYSASNKDDKLEKTKQHMSFKRNTPEEVKRVRERVSKKGLHGFSLDEVSALSKQHLKKQNDNAK